MIEARLRVELRAELRVLSAEAGINEVLGYSSEDLTNGLVRLGHLIHPDDADIALQLFCTEPTATVEVANLRMRHADGRIRCIRAEFSRRGTPQGGIELLLLLQDARSLPRTMVDAAGMPTLRAMLENTDDFIYFKDRNHVFTGASQTLVSLCEPVAHWTDFIGKTDYDVFPEAYADIYYRLEKAVFAGSEVAQDVQQTLTRDGQRGWVDNRKYPIRDDSGDIVGLYGVARDITELKQAQADLETYSDHLEDIVQQRTVELGAIFDAAPIGIVLLRNRVVLKCNRMLETLLGYDREELIGHSTRAWYRNDTEFELFGERLYPHIEGGETVHREQEMIRKDGTRLWARVSIRLLEPGMAGSVALATVADITQERLAIEEMDRAREMAEDAANTKAAFLANMSHEIRTPMNAVIGMTHLALKADPPPTVRDYLHKIHGASQHLLSVINDILDYSKLEAGKTVLEHDAFKLEQLFDELTAVFGERIARKGLEFVIRVEPEVPRQLVGDVFRIRQVLINLVSNAIKFTDQGHVSVVVSATESAEAQALICFAVSDSGIGLSEEQCRNLFQSFHQADASTTRKFGGSGLGLAISLRLARLMQGDITIQSKPGSGSTFAFTARLAIGDTARPAEPALPDLRVPCGVAHNVSPSTQARPEALAPHPEFKGLKVLVAEDNELSQEVAKGLLNLLGVEADIAENGAVAVDMVRQHPYGLVFMDMQMPVMDGLTATREIRRHATPADLPIVAMTANVMSRDRQRCLAAGMNDHIGKPIDPQTLIATLHTWLKRPAPPAVAAPAPATPAAASAPAGTPGAIDPQQGLAQVAGIETLYHQILEQFVAGQRDAAERIGAALRAADWHTAEQIAHNLKGTAAQIGAMPLHRMAGRLQHLTHARQAGDELDALLRDTLQEMQAVIASAKAILAQG
ncbi:PAS domain S-box protein [Zoogloea dura]|uniref:Sensory/regulatory protein RpfC n=1 Tax=Zoogloea dura TaxID=2728840 RepID=A0A848GBD4_9RHOO|nr:PAS domain S-box protein [Zoogloea dura]NML28442.1 PAS domain S-box protein [Zoogloea dura]